LAADALWEVSMFRMLFAAVAVACLCGSAVRAEDYPTRPVRIIVPTAPGGSADTLARMLADHLNRAMGQQFYVDNRPGAGNIIGIEAAAHAPADGYTFLLGAGTITITHVVKKDMPYDVLRDFVPVTQLTSVPNVLVVHPSQPIHSLAEYIAYAKANPGKLTYASAGVGSNLHLSMELLKTMTGIDVVHVPYKGVGPALQDTLAGHVASMVSNLFSAKPHIDAGKLRALGVTSAKRAPALPSVPSIAEAGVPGYEVLNWFGLFAPAGTPAPIVARIQTEAAKMLAEPKTKAILSDEGADPVGSSSADFAVFVKAEIAKWTKVGQAAGLKPE
jgi:tripartite-type tricarboxylate transporter receptor subunit TctC